MTTTALPDALMREACPHCGLDALTGPNAHTKPDGCINALRLMHLNYQRRIGEFVLNRLEEVKNESGGVIGYKLNLTADETDNLCREIDK